MEKMIEAFIEDAPYVNFNALLCFVQQDVIIKINGLQKCGDIVCYECPVKYTCNRTNFNELQSDNLLEELIELKSSNPEYFI